MTNKRDAFNGDLSSTYSTFEHSGSFRSYSTCSSLSSVALPIKSCLKSDQSSSISTSSSTKNSRTTAMKQGPPITGTRRRRGPSATTSSNTQQRQVLEPAPERRTVISFSVVEIREFERVVGDNPSCSSGRSRRLFLLSTWGAGVL